MGIALTIFIIGVGVGSVATSYVWTRTRMYKRAKDETEEKLREYGRIIYEKIWRKTES
jgi:hypothetical protein